VTEEDSKVVKEKASEGEPILVAQIPLIGGLYLVKPNQRL